MLLFLTGCIGTVEQDRVREHETDGDETDSDGSYPWTSPPTPRSCGFTVRTGFASEVLASVIGPAEEEDTPPMVLGDHDGDGVPEIGIVCRAEDYQTMFVSCDGAAALAGTCAVGGTINSDDAGVTGVGDLDGDGLQEVGFGISWYTHQNWELPWWYVRPSASLTGETDVEDGAWVITGDGNEYGGGAVLPLGDFDADGVPDLAVWQEPGGADPRISILSGNALLASGGLSAVTGAAAMIVGIAFEDTVRAIVPAGDLTGDGAVDLAVGIDRGTAGYEVGPAPEIQLLWGTDLSDPSHGFAIRGAEGGRDRYEEAVNLGDLDGDGLDELAVLLASFTSSEEYFTEVAVVPGSVLALGATVDAAPFALGGDLGRPRSITACDLDADGLPELIVGDGGGGTWDGRDLLVPGTEPVAPALDASTCAGDLDGAPGSELLVVEQF